MNTETKLAEISASAFAQAKVAAIVTDDAELDDEYTQFAVSCCQDWANEIIEILENTTGGLL